MPETDFRPNSDRVLVDLEEYTTTNSGLHIPQTANAGARKGTVVAVGPGRPIDGRVVPPPFSPGDRVLVDNPAGMKVQVGQKDYQLVRSEEILGKFV